MYKNEKLQNVLFAFVGSKQAIETIPAKIAEKLYQNEKFFDNLAKAPEWLQTKVIDVMATAEDGTFWAKMVGDGSKLSGLFSKITSALKKAKTGKFVSAVSKLVKSPLAKKMVENPVVKKLMGPWGGIIIDSGFSAFEAYNDPNSAEYHSVGKSIMGGTMSAIKNASPLDGALIGAEIGMSVGGPVGLVVGGFAGVGVVLLKDGLFKIAESTGWDKKIKDGAYSLYDKVAHSKVGQAISNGVSKIKNTAGQAIHFAETTVKNTVSAAVSNGKKVAQNIFNAAAKSILPKPATTLGWFS